MALSIAMLCSGSTPGRAQVPGWTVRRSALADLWYHGVALTRFAGFGALPLYAPGYADSVAAARRTSGVTTLLDQQASRFRERFAADSAFEVLHFLPLYFPQSDPTAMLTALRDASHDSEAASRRVGPVERFGIAAALAALPEPAQRAALEQFAAALQEEWSGDFSRAYAQADSQGAKAVQQFTAAWRPLEAALGPYLERYRLGGGLLLLVAPLGPDGRLFEGDPRSSNDNVLAVALPRNPPDAVAFVVRELCYPAVRRALLSARRTETDRIRSERTSGVAAVRCGALLLARYAPGMVSRYEAVWVEASGRARPFTDAFPLPDDLLRALEGAIAAR